TVSDLDLRPQLDHLVRRDAEELRRRARVAGEEHEERPPPPGEARAAGRDEGLAAEEIARATAIDREPLRRRAAHDVGDVRRLHEPVVRDHAPEAGAELGNVDTVGERYDRLVGG